MVCSVTANAAYGIYVLWGYFSYSDTMLGVLATLGQVALFKDFSKSSYLKLVCKPGATCLWSKLSGSLALMVCLMLFKLDSIHLVKYVHMSISCTIIFLGI